MKKWQNPIDSQKGILIEDAELLLETPEDVSNASTIFEKNGQFMCRISFLGRNRIVVTLTNYRSIF